LFPKVKLPYAFTWKLSVASVMFLWPLKYQSEALHSAAPLVQGAPSGRYGAWMIDHDTDAYYKIVGAFVESRPSGNLTRDNILDNITLYWLTGTGASAARSYWEAYGPDAPGAGEALQSDARIPVAFTTFPGEIWRTPRSWVEKSYSNVVYFNEVDKGGHFAAWEEPELFSEELRGALASVRSEHQSRYPRRSLMTTTSMLPDVGIELREGHAEVGDVNLHYVEAGDGPLIVLLHGFPEFWFGWRSQIAPLAAAGFRVVAPDTRGYNLSSKPEGFKECGVDLLADDIRGLIGELGAESALLVGHDWGGSIAWTVAMNHPEVVDRLAVRNVAAAQAIAAESRLTTADRLKRSRTRVTRRSASLSSGDLNELARVRRIRVHRGHGHPADHA
jgi:pimeloyl-ACP methyl ester carboxylesterase